MIDITSPAPSTSLDHPQIEQLQNIMSDLWRDYRRDVETLQSKVAAVDLAYAGCPKPSDTSPSWFDGPRAAQLQQACHGSQYDLSHVELWAISAADAIAGGEGAESASQEAWDPLLAISTVEKDSRWVKAENEKEENRPALSNLYSALTEYYQAAETILPNARKRVLSTLAMPLGLTINPNRSDNSVKSTCDAIRSSIQVEHKPVVDTYMNHINGTQAPDSDGETLMWKAPWKHVPSGVFSASREDYRKWYNNVYKGVTDKGHDTIT